MNASLLLGGLGVALLFSTLGCGGGSLDPTSEAGKLERARIRWEAAGIRSYRFTVTRSAFAPLGYNGPGTITVTEGVVTRVEGEVVAGALDAFDTIPELFLKAQLGLETEGGTVVATYDEVTGVPKSIYVDPIALAVDDESGYTVTDFQAL